MSVHTDAILKEAAKDLKGVESTLEDAKDARNILAEAGEPTEEFDTLIRENETRLARWKATLKARGVKTE